MGADDLGVRKAARALYGVLRAMEAETETTYLIEVGPMSQSFLENTGGGLTGCSAATPRCGVYAASNGSHTGPLTTLAHEAGAAWSQRRGASHFDMTGSIKWENAARRVFGCSLRADHAAAPAACK
jgi:hypothetical protein